MEKQEGMKFVNGDGMDEVDILHQRTVNNLSERIKNLEEQAKKIREKCPPKSVLLAAAEFVGEDTWTGYFLTYLANDFAPNFSSRDYIARQRWITGGEK